MKPMFPSQVRLSQFEEFVALDVANGGRSHQRLGQHYMNCLARFDGPLYNMITGTLDDPFYNDNKLEAFFRRIMEHWAETWAETPQERML